MANRPNNTPHLYETSEICSLHLNGIRLGRVKDAVFATIERDISGNGNAAFCTNFIAATEDIGIANPASVIIALICYNRWINIMKQKFGGSTRKSYTCPEARQFLIAATVALSRSMKSRIEPDLSIYSINMKLDQIASMNPEEYDVDKQVEEACSWVTKLGPATGNGITCDGNVGIDAEKIVKLFGILLWKTTEVWAKIAKKKVNLKKQETNPSDPSIDKDAIDDPEADEKAVLLFESNLMMVAQIIYAIDSYEKRRLPKAKTKPEFVTKALENFPESWGNQFPKISGKSEKMFARPVAWTFAPLFEVAYKMYPKRQNSTVLVLLGLLELCAREVGNDRSNFLDAILFTVRCRTLNWKNNEIKPDEIIAEKEIADLMKLYDECPPIVEGNDNHDIRDPMKLSTRRVISIPPEYLDRTTFRGRGKNTMEYLTKGANAIGVDISSWDKEEIDKSHGPGVELFKKQSEGTPTYMSFYLDNSTLLNQEQDVFENPYKDKARKILLKTEEKFGHEKCNEKEMTVLMYPTWVDAFSCKLPDRNDDAEDESKGKKSKGKGKGRITKDTVEKNPRKKGDDHSQEERMILVQKKTKDGLEPSLRPGSLIRIKKIIYEDADEPSDEETEDYVKKRVTMQKNSARSKNKKESSNDLGSDNDDDDGEDSEDEAKKISKLKKNKEKLKAVVYDSKKITKKSKKSKDEDSEDMEVDEPKEKKPVSRKRTKEQDDEGEKPAKKQKKSKSNDLAKFNILEAVDYKVLSEEDRMALQYSPLAQKPIGNAKKFVHFLGDKVFKGPYNPALGKDVEVIQRVLYRTFRMKKQWRDDILIDQELVYDDEEKMLYLVSDNICGAKEYETEEIILNTHDKKRVDIVKKESSGIQLLSKTIQSPGFESLIGPAMVDLAARYLIGSGGGHFGEIIVTEDTQTMGAIDVEDNREKVPVYTDNPTPHLLDILFVNKKQPAKSNDRFYALLPSTLGALKEFIKTVKTENIEETVAYAQSIGYTAAPSQQIINKRLETLEKCISDNEENHKNFKTNGDGIPKMPENDDDKLAEVINAI